MLQITDQTTYVEIFDDVSGKAQNFPKNVYKLGRDPINTSRIQLLQGGAFVYGFNYLEVSVPNTANPEALVEILTGYFFSASGGGGTSDATAANQVLQISEAQETNTILLALGDEQATAAAQATQQTTLDAINAKTPALDGTSQPVITKAKFVTDTINSLNDEAILAVDGFAGVAIDLRGSGSWTVTFAGTIDGTNYFNLIATPVASAANVNTVSTATAAGAWYVNCQGCSFVRARATTYANGTITATLRATTHASWTYQAPIGSTNAIAGTVTANLGTGGTGATALGKAEDAVAANGDTGVAQLNLRNDAPTSNVSASGDYAVPVVDIYGARIVKDQQRHKRTYRAAFVVTPAANPTDVFQLIGSATTTVEINKIWIAGTQSSADYEDIYIVKRSTANTGGTSSASTNVPMISTDAAATAVGSIYTANPTLGTTVGNVYIQPIPVTSSSTVINNSVEISFGEAGKPLLLSGVAQAMAINLNGAAVSGLVLRITVEWCEY